MKALGVRWAVVLLSLFLLAGCGRQGARISGVVTSAEGSNPVPGISVHVEGQAVTTNDEGQYELADLDPGTYTIRVEAEGYEAWSREVVLKAGSTYLLDIALSPVRQSYGQVRGTIRDAQTGDPVAGVAISLAGEDRVTDEQGRFTFDQVPLGEQALLVSKQGYKPVDRGVIVPEEGPLVLELALIPERASVEPGADGGPETEGTQTLPAPVQAVKPAPGFSFPPSWLREELGQWEGETSAEYEWDDYPDGYRVTIKADHILTSRISRSTGPIVDFAVEVGVTQRLTLTPRVRVQWLQGRNPEGYIASYYGVVFRSPDEDNGYAFLVSTNGHYMVWKFQEGEDFVLIPWTSSDLIRCGREIGDFVNRLGIVAHGADFEFYINGTLVNTVTDDSFGSGYLGVLAATGTHIDDFDVRFHDIKLAVAPVTLAREEAQAELSPVPVVSVPEGASYTSSDLSIVTAEEPPLPEDAEALSPVWDITLEEGRAFDAPATVSVPVNLSQPLGKNEIITAAYWNGETWVPIGGTLSEEQTEFSVTVTHFSSFTVLKLRLPLVPVKTEHFRVVSLVPGEDLEALANRLETAWEMVIDELGFLEPISTLGGGRINVWVHPLLGGAGEAERSWLAEHLFDYVNYNIYIRAGLSGLEAVSTPAHEFFHIVQINGYLHPYEKSDLAPYLWWMEATATWIGSIFADRDGSFARGAEYERVTKLAQVGLIEAPLTEPGQLHPYLLGPFVEFLETKMPGMVRETWSRIGTLILPLDALKQVCEAHGEDPLKMYCEFLLDYYFVHSLPWLGWDTGDPTSASVTSRENSVRLGTLAPLAGEALEILATPASNEAPSELIIQLEDSVRGKPSFLFTIWKQHGEWCRPEMISLNANIRIPYPANADPLGVMVFNQGGEAISAGQIPMQVDFVSIDTEPPTVELTSAPESPVVGQPILFQWKGEDDLSEPETLKYSYRLQGHDDTWTPWEHVLQTSFEGLPEGSYRFELKARDKAGNESTPIEFLFALVPAEEAPNGVTGVSARAPLWDVMTIGLRDVRDLCFSSDGRALLAGMEEGSSVQLFKRVENEWVLVRTFEGHTAGVLAVTLSPDGALAASGGRDGTVRIWEIGTGRQLRIIDVAKEAEKSMLSVYSVAFTPDGLYLAAGTSHNSTFNVGVWELSTGTLVAAFNTGVYTDGKSVSFSPDGELLAVATGGSITVWEWKQGEVLLRLGEDVDNNVRAVAFSPNGRYLASSGDMCVLWDINTGRALRKALPGGCDVAFSSDGKLVVTGGAWTVALFSTPTLIKLVQKTDDNAYVTCVSLSPNGEFFAVGFGGGDDNTIRIYDSANGELVTNFDEQWRFYGSLIAARFMHPSTEDLLLTTEGKWGRLASYIWVMGTGKLARLHWPAFDTAVGLQGDIFAGLLEGGELLFKERVSGSGWTRMSLSPQGATRLCSSADTKLLAVGLASGSIKILDAFTAEELKTLRGHIDDISAIAFSPTGELLAAGSRDDTITLWEVSSGELLGILAGHESSITSVVFSPDGSLLASSGIDGHVKLWDVNVQTELQSFSGRDSLYGGVWCVAFSPDGRFIAYPKETCIVIREVNSGHVVRELLGQGDLPRFIVFSREGYGLITGSHVVKLWDVSDLVASTTPLE